MDENQKLIQYLKSEIIELYQRAKELDTEFSTIGSLMEPNYSIERSLSSYEWRINFPRVVYQRMCNNYKAARILAKLHDVLALINKKKDKIIKLYEEDIALTEAFGDGYKIVDQSSSPS